MNGPSDGPLETTIPFPSIENDVETPEPAVDSKENVKGKEKDGTPKKKPPAHRRSISGNLLKLLRSGSAERVEQDGSASEPSVSRSAMGAAMSDTQRRRRKGSLRKTVLGKGREKDRDRKGKSPLASPSVAVPAATSYLDIDPSDSTALSTPRPSVEFSPDDAPTSPEVVPASSGNPPRWPFRTLSRVSIPSIRSSVASVEPASSTTSARNSTARLNDVSTFSTEDDEDDDEVAMPPSRRPLQQQPLLRKIPTTSSLGGASESSSTSYSYFPTVSVSVSTAPSIIGDSLRRSSLGYFGSSAAAAAATHARSPLASLPQSVAGTPPSDAEDEGEDQHDYAETAFWGYVILVVSWVVFVVGMGSCFDLWSWAWDVGETPYAPPELEDDPSLPITGYYPALMVLTAIMAWVWVVVAWVGMKYFRHADFKGEEL